MEICVKSVKNNKTFLNSILKKGKSKVHASVARCLQYICITALYQIVTFAFVDGFDDLKHRIGELKDKFYKKEQETETETFWIRDEAFLHLETDFFAKYVSGEDADDRFAFQGSFFYTVYFKFLALKSGCTGAKQPASVGKQKKLAESAVYDLEVLKPILDGGVEKSKEKKPAEQHSDSSVVRPKRKSSAETGELVLGEKGGEHSDSSVVIPEQKSFAETGKLVLGEKEANAAAEVVGRSEWQNFGKKLDSLSEQLAHLVGLREKFEQMQEKFDQQVMVQLSEVREKVNGMYERMVNSGSPIPVEYVDFLAKNSVENKDEKEQCGAVSGPAGNPGEVTGVANAVRAVAFANRHEGENDSDDDIMEQILNQNTTLSKTTDVVKSAAVVKIEKPEPSLRSGSVKKRQGVSMLQKGGKKKSKM
jgi:hypothetical protein